MRFINREEAGLLLAHAVAAHRSPEAIVLGLPRGGLAVAIQVARDLGAPMDIVVARKIAAPGRPEMAIGAVSEGAARWVDVGRARALGLSPDAVRRAVAAAEAEVVREAQQLRRGRPSASLRGRVALIVDDGLATGATARAAVLSARERGAGRVVLAVPVAACSIVAALRPHVDAIVSMWQPAELHSVAEWYDDFSEVDDGALLALLEQARDDRGFAAAS